MGRQGAAEQRASLGQIVADYNDAWNRHDLDAICAAHAPGMVFENHNAGERAEGDAVRSHIESIFRNWPDLSFRSRRTYVGDDFVVQEWTATARHPGGRTLSWDGLDIFPFEDGKIARKDVYSNASRRVPEQLAEP
jgi:steroid delta-isomerase-like uncharacterized protein